MSLTLTRAFHTDIGFPRVSGDEPPILDATEIYSGFSPRERG